MIVVPFVGTPHRHDDKVFLSVQAKVVHRGLEEMYIFTKPLGEVDGRENFAHGDDKSREQVERSAD